MSNLAALEASASARYTQLREGFLAGNVSSACLSYQAFYQCVSAMPRCQLGRQEELCRFVCEEHARRCLKSDYSGCESNQPAGEVCTSAAAPRAGLAAFIAAALAVAALR